MFSHICDYFDQESMTLRSDAMWLPKLNLINALPLYSLGTQPPCFKEAQTSPHRERERSFRGATYRCSGDSSIEPPAGSQHQSPDLQVRKDASGLRPLSRPSVIPS